MRATAMVRCAARRLASTSAAPTAGGAQRASGVAGPVPLYRAGSRDEPRRTLRMATEFSSALALQIPAPRKAVDTAPPAPVFPNLTCTTLSGDKLCLGNDVFGRAPLTLLLLSANSSSEAKSALDAWATPFRLHFGDVIIRTGAEHLTDEDCARPKIVQLVVEQDTLSSAIRQLVRGASAQSHLADVPTMRHHDYLSYRGDPSAILPGLDERQLDTHVLLIDRAANIRWLASGDPATDDLIAMSNTALQVLMESVDGNESAHSSTMAGKSHSLY